MSFSLAWPKFFGFCPLDLLANFVNLNLGPFVAWLTSGLPFGSTVRRLLADFGRTCCQAWVDAEAFWVDAGSNLHGHEGRLLVEFRTTLG